MHYNQVFFSLQNEDALLNLVLNIKIKKTVSAPTKHRNFNLSHLLIIITTTKEHSINLNEHLISKEILRKSVLIKHIIESPRIILFNFRILIHKNQPILHI